MAYGTRFVQSSAGVGFTEAYGMHPQHYISQGRASFYLGMDESELVVKLRAGTIKGLYNPSWSADAPCWWVSLDEINKFNAV